MSTKQKYIKNIVKTLLERYPEKFSENFEENKLEVTNLTNIKTRKIRNIVAGLLVKKIKSKRRKGMPEYEKKKKKIQRGKR
jgi:small subunit ribosomal protein S17e